MHLKSVCSCLMRILSDDWLAFQPVHLALAPLSIWPLCSSARCQGQCALWSACSIFQPSPFLEPAAPDLSPRSRRDLHPPPEPLDLHGLSSIWTGEILAALLQSFRLVPCQGWHFLIFPLELGEWVSCDSVWTRLKAWKMWFNVVSALVADLQEHGLINKDRPHMSVLKSSVYILIYVPLCDLSFKYKYNKHWLHKYYELQLFFVFF